ncbi:MAG: hypothetical protein QOE70_6717 [Chthoniobacter sp.]|nr:hypothetical protein [Chthoniobacter sp.]
METAADGAEGLARFKEGGWDLVLTDRTMPKLNGDELAAAVKAIDPRMPIVMVSGSIEELPEAIGKRRAVDVFVHKPFTLDALTSAIAKARESAAR